jgi:hypothetical protein
MKRILFAILLISSRAFSEDCNHHHDEAQEWLKKAEDAAKAALVAAGGASFLLPGIGTFIVSAAGAAVAAAFQRKHDICIDRYNDCIRNNREAQEAQERREREVRNKERRERSTDFESMEAEEHEETAEEKQKRGWEKIWGAIDWSKVKKVNVDEYKYKGGDLNPLGNINIKLW